MNIESQGLTAILPVRTELYEYIHETLKLLFYKLNREAGNKGKNKFRQYIQVEVGSIAGGIHQPQGRHGQT